MRSLLLLNNRRLALHARGRRLLFAGVCLTVLAPVPGLGGTLTEDFTTTAYKDTVNTTVDWNTVDGELRGFPFTFTAVGAYDTPGLAAGVAVAGDLAFVADGDAGLQVIDITDPTTPTLVSTYSTSGAALAVVVSGNLAFVTDLASGLRVVDITDPTTPTLVSTHAASFASAVAVSGDLVFLVDQGGLQVIDVSSPTAPVLAGTFSSIAQDLALSGNLAFLASDDGLQVVDVADPTTPTLVSTHFTFAQDVAISGNLAFVAKGTAGLEIVDITNPAAPTLVSDTGGLGGFAGDVVVSGDKAFVANGESGLQVIDISDPTAPNLVGAYDTFYAGGVVVSGDKAFVADEASGLQVIGIGTPTLPTPLGTVEIGGRAEDWETNFGYQQSIYKGSRRPAEAGVVVSGDLALVTFQNWGVDECEASYPYSENPKVYVSNFGLKIVDITNATAPAVLSDVTFGLCSVEGSFVNCNYNDVPYVAMDVTVSGDLAILVADVDRSGYLVDGWWCCFNQSCQGGTWGLYKGFMYLIDISDPTAPQVLSSIVEEDGFTPRGVAVAGRLAFVAAGSSGLRVYDISDPAVPVLIGTHPAFATDVAVSGNLAFVATNDNPEAGESAALLVIDISDPTTPTVVGLIPGGGGPETDVAVSGDHAFFVAQGSLHVIDITDPTAPALAGSYTTGSTLSVSVSGDMAFVADFFAGLQVIDISDPTAPVLLYSDPAGNRGLAVDVSGEQAFVANTAGHLQSFQVFSSVGSGGRGQSIVLEENPYPIIRARFMPTQTSGVSWELSTDGGSSFQPFTPGVWDLIEVPGTDPVWRSTHGYNPYTNPGVNPTVSDLTLQWRYDVAPIVSITDVPDDQGGLVNVSFSRSGFDFPDETLNPIVGYAIYRRVDDPVLAQKVLALDAPSPDKALGHPGLASFDSDQVRVLAERTFVIGSSQVSSSTLPPGVWEGAGWIPATQIDGYTARVSTLSDSTSTGGGQSVLVTAVITTTPGVFYASAPDSGYSVDNIAPSVPQGFAASYDQGNVNLSWNPAPEPDFEYFRVYRSSDPAFVPGPATLVQETASTSWQDAPADPGSAFYKLTALDLAGNESEPASLDGATAVEDGPGVPTRFALHSNVPNPFNPSTKIRFDLPQAGKVELTIYDLAGRRVRTLVQDSRDAGSYDVIWRGFDDSGKRVASGVYLYKLQAGSYVEARRMILLK